MKDLKESIQEVRDANGEWRSTFDARDEAVALLDAEGRILCCNKAMEEFAKKPYSEIIGHACNEICICIGGHSEQCPMIRCRTSLQREAAVFNHAEQWFEVSVDPIFNKAGQLQGAVHILRDITDFKQLGSELKDAVTRAEDEKAKAESILDALGGGISIQDRDFRILYQNLAQRRMVGDHVGEFCYRAYEKREERCEGCGVAMVFENSGTHIVQRSAPTDKGLVHVEITSSPLLDAKGNVIAAIEVVHDITERKQSEDRLRDSEARYRSVAENAFDMIQSIAPDGRFLYVNPAWLRTMGYTREELANKTIFDIIHPSCQSKCSSVFSHLSSGSSVEHFETQFAAKDGRVIDVEGSASVNMVDGKVKSMQCLLHDITERKRLEEELFRSQQDWEYTFDSITDMVTVHDKDFNIILANKAAEKMLGLPILDKAMDRKCFEYYHGTDHAPEGCPSCGCLGSSTPATFEVFEPHLNMFVEIRAIPRLDSSGNLIGLIHVVRDISERKKAEAERESLHLEKEQLLEQLLQSQKMEAVGTLSGGIAHDFNNILNVIIGYSGLLENMPGMTGRAEEFLSEIINAANRAANLTRGLLAFSRKQHLELKPTDLNDIVRNITAMLHRVIGEDIRCNIELSEDNLVIVCDSGQIEQVVVNLASNARDAMPKGGQLTLRTGIVELDKAFCAVRGFGNPGSYAVISLTDTGVGMNEEIVQRIFEPFFTTKAVGKGTGLGLSITYGIVAQHKGFLECKSEPGHGTVFTIYLPLGMISEPVEEIKEKRADVARGKGETILVAEDDESGRRLIKVVLEHQGYRVIEAVNGIEVIEQFREHSQDIALMLLDVIMPDMHGYDALSMIRQQFPDTKAILMSGYTADILEQRGITELPVSLLKKPISPHKLLKAVRDVLDE